jgi:hypothetical protein
MFTTPVNFMLMMTAVKKPPMNANGNKTFRLNPIPNVRAIAPQKRKQKQKFGIKFRHFHVYLA